MITLRSWAPAIAGAILSASIASAQIGEISPGQFLGNESASAREARGASLSAMLDRACSSTNNMMLQRQAGSWVCSVTLSGLTLNLSSNTLSGTIAQFNTALSDADFATLAGTETLTNKTFNLTSNTLTGTIAQFNTALSDANFATLAGTETLTSKTINLASNTLSGTIAQFNTALSDADFATLAGTETLTSKTINLASNTLSGTIAQFNAALSDADFATHAGAETLSNKTLTAPVLTGVANNQGAWQFSGNSSPAQITSNQNNYNPSSVVCTTATTLRINSDAARDITGLAGGTDGCVMIVYNVGVFPITLKDSNVSSSAANQFQFGADLVLQSKQGATLIYNSTSTGWRQIGGPSVSGGGAGTVTSVATDGSMYGGPISTSGTLGVQVPIEPGGRCTLTAGTPVMTVSTPAQTTVRYTPYKHQWVPIYDGTRFVNTNTGGELTQATTDATKSPAAVAASSVYDVFVWNDAGTIRATRGPAWTNDTTRSAGTALARVNGMLVNNAAITNGPAANRGTYVCTIRSNTSLQIEYIFGGIGPGGTAASFRVWNMYNRVPVATSVGDDTNDWNYTVATWRASNNSGNMRVSFVRGLDEDGVSAQFIQCAANASATAFVGISLELDLGRAASSVGCDFCKPECFVCERAIHGTA